MKKPFLTRLGAPVWWVGAFALGPWALQARELPQVDALANAPVLAQTKAQAALPEGVARWSREERLGVPSFVWMKPPTGVATKQASQGSTVDATQAARDVLKRLAPAYGLSAQEVDAAPLHHRQAMAGGAQLVRFSQKKAGVEVFREHATVLLNAQSQAVSVGGYLGSTAEAPVAKAAGQSAMTGTGAIAQALADFGFDTSVAQQLQPKAQVPGADTGAYTWYVLPGVEGADGAVLESARSKPVWFRLPQGLVQAHYVEVVVHEGAETYGYAYVFGAGDGQLLLRNNQTAHAADFSYRVWADPATGVPLQGAQGRNGSPYPAAAPNGYAAPFVPAGLVTWANAPFSRNDPWLAASATTTAGNNVNAYADLQAPDGFQLTDADECTGAVNGDVHACTTAPATFDHAYDFGQGPRATKSQVAASVVNLFYTTNWLHDWFYDAGFDEVAGNAQNDNFGRGGTGGDALNVEALDYDGTNNANMRTPADGAVPRMRMYRYINTASASATVTAPAALAQKLVVGAAQFGPGTYSRAGDVVLANPVGACAALTNGNALAGKIALVDRGICSFAVKVKYAQDAGAIAVVVADNQEGAPTGMSGTDASITIPSVRIAKADGAAWKAALASSTPLQVQLLRSTASTERSSAMDNTIVAHEWGHFISNRLIGDSNGLTSNHAQGLGEGWGDFHALLMTVTEQDRQVAGNANFEGTYASGTYAQHDAADPSQDASNVAYFGIRRYPYSTDLSKNPLTFKHIQDGVSLPSGIPINANSAANAEVHNMGEVWAGMLWQCYASLLNRHVFSDAQTRMKNYLVAGYKLTPIKPTLTEARDALLAAMAATDTQDYDSCAQGFAQRGAGMNAKSPDRYSTTNSGVEEDFAQSGALALGGMELSLSAAGAQRCDADDVLDAGETGVLQITVHNRGGAAVTDGQLQLSASVPGVEFVAGAVQALPSMAAWSTQVISVPIKATSITMPQWAKLTAAITYTGQVQSQQQDLVVALHQDLHAASSAADSGDAFQSTMVFGSSMASGQAPWALAWDAGLNAFYQGLPPAMSGSSWMQTPDLHITGSTTLSFKHSHRFEADGIKYYDGGQLMVSADGGLTWNPVPNAGYNGTLYLGVGDGDSKNPHAGEVAYVGQSADWPALQTQSVDLSAYVGQTVRLGWFMHTDMAGTDEGWQVDDIVFTGLGNLPFPLVVADAQSCAPLLADGGSGQSATVGAAFALPLRVKLLDAAGVAMAGEEISFTTPASGASAVFAGGLTQAVALTDVDGVAQSPALTANALAGSYSVVATRGAQSLQFALTNTADNDGGNTGSTGGTPVALLFSGPSPLGQGTVTAFVQSAQQTLPATARFTSGVIVAEGTVPALDGFYFPFGLADFVLQDVGVGNAVTMRMHYPAAVPAGAEYWKWGRTEATGPLHWYQIPMILVDANTVEITLTDGGEGDSDNLADGVITDPGGLAVPRSAVAPVATAVPVPALSGAGWLALALLLGASAAMGGVRRKL